MRTLQIGSRRIGAGERTLVIAEIGVNHDGSVQRAIELVDVAARCGADAVKLQIFRAATLMHSSAAFAVYQESRCADATPADMLRRYELSAEAAGQIVQATRECGLLPIATPFSPEDVELIEELKLPAVKIASPDLVNRPLLARAAGSGRPLVISTGAATLAEVQASVWWLREREARFALLHCVSAYPTPDTEANLCWIREMAGRFDVPVGYSDHTTNELSGALAVAAGACVVEKHLTYDNAADGPDHAASADPEAFARYVGHIRSAERLLGGGGKRVLDIEKDVRRVSRQSLVVRKAVRPGEPLRECDLTVRRPGTGIPAAMLAIVTGRRAKVRIEADTLLQWDMLADAA